MSKKVLIASGTFILVLVILSGFFFLRQKKTLVSSLPETSSSLLPSWEKEKLLLYEDEAGFSFNYPQSLGIVEKEVDKPNIYSSLELSTKSKPQEKLIVKITDTSLITVDQWLSKNPQEASLVSVAQVTLAGMEGKSLKYTSPSKNLILVIDGGILYYLEAPSDGDFWDKTLKTLSSSFKLTEEKAASFSEGSPPVTEEEEEIIE